MEVLVATISKLKRKPSILERKNSNVNISACESDTEVTQYSFSF